MDKDKGFVVLNRNILQWRWYDDAYMFKFFVTLIMLANFETKEWHEETIERGSFVTSIAKLCEHTKMSRNAVVRCLKSLIKTGEITEVVKPNNYRIITILNYEKYQDIKVGLPKTNSRGNVRGNNRGNSKTNIKTNSRGTTKQYNNGNNGNTVPLAPQGRSGTVEVDEKSVQPSPSSPLGGEPSKPKSKGLIPYAEVERYSRKKGMSDACYDDYSADVFHTAFERSGTHFPDNWKQLYDRFVHLSDDEQLTALKRIKSGEFKELWNR